ncbi:MAG: MBOAT family protein [Clostridiales bacterium]|nr:MBOAT family protein [Clostridiales bacterium]
MVFSSTAFIFAFLPVVLTGYYLTPRRLKNLFLLVSSFVFYFSSEVWLTWIMLVSIGVDYVCALTITRNQMTKRNKRSTSQKIALLLSLAANLGILFYFKYCGFFIENVNSVLTAIGLSEMSWPIRNIALPMGISFYTFQSMSYTIDVYMGRVAPTRNLIDFATYVSLFPQLVAGPIIRYRHIHEQLKTRQHSSELFVSGIKRFIIGLAKKVLIADVIAKIVDQTYALPPNQLTCALAWIGTISFMLQIYFDFSGYSDMAIGLGRMIGFRFIENFNYPFIATSFKNFWSRWHISMTTWFRDYVYIPLCSRYKTNAYVAIVVTFLLCGLWHGAHWNFVFFGIYSAIMLMLERWKLNQLLNQLPIWSRHIYTLLVIFFCMFLFRCADIEQISNMTYAMVTPQAGNPLQHPLARYLTSDIIFAFFIGVIGSTPVFTKIRHIPRTIRFIGYASLLFLCYGFVAGKNFTPFLYFRF